MSKIMNVFGEIEDDPICNFMDCYHPFSVHGKRSHQKQFNCNCKHPSVNGYSKKGVSSLMMSYQNPPVKTQDPILDSIQKALKVVRVLNRENYKQPEIIKKSILDVYKEPQRISTLICQ